MGYKIILFDFDGTIADTFDAAVEIWNILAREYRFRPLPSEDIETARDMSTRQLMKFLGVPATRLPGIASRGIRELRSRISAVQPIPGMPDALRALRAAGIPLGILTSNSSENVMTVCRQHDIDFFQFVRTSSRLLGKAHEMKALLRDLQLEPHEVLYVGDETRDIEASRKVGMPVAAVAWGYNSEKALRALEPEFYLTTPTELVSVCASGVMPPVLDQPVLDQ